MFYKLFKSYHPILVIIIPLAGISLWINSFIDTPDYTYFQFDYHQMPLYRLILSWFGNNILTTSIVSLSLIIIIGFLLVRLSTKYILLKERTYLPAFLYVVMVSGLPALQRINPAIIASLFLVFAIEKILDSYRKRGISYNYFEASFIISLGSLFYHDLIYLALYIWIAHTIFRPFNLREWFFILIGALLPYILLISYYFIFKDQLIYIIDVLYSAFSYDANIIGKTNITHYIFFGFLIFILLISTYRMIGMFRLQKVQIRNYLLSFIWLLFFSTLIILFSPTAGMEMLFIISVPSAIIMAHYFMGIKARWWGEIVFFILVLILVFIQLYDKLV